MIKELNPSDVLKSSSRLIGHGKFIFESEENNVLGSNNEYSIPYDQRRLAIVITTMTFNGMSIDHIFTNNAIREILARTQEFALQKLYKSYQTVNMLAYVSNLNELCNEFSSEVLIILNNDVVLEQEGYHPNILDAQIKRLEDDLSLLINENLVTPFRSWLNSVLQIIQMATSPRSARLSLKNFTGIASLESEKKRLSIPSFYSLMRGRIDPTQELYEFLLKKKLIAQNTQLKSVADLFNENKDIITKIVWTGMIGELQAFINEMVDAKLIHDPSYRWATTKLLFLNTAGEDLPESFGHNDPITDTSTMIELSDFLKTIVAKKH